jgi:hypothetical protein
VAGELRLPPGKRSRLKDSVREMLDRKSCTSRLPAACYKGGQAWEVLHHHIRLGIEPRADLAWWDAFAERWNRRSILVKPASVTVTSDSSGSWGCGAFLDKGEAWFQWQWPPEAASKQIAVKELFPILIAAACWGSTWREKTICCRCDNMAVVRVVTSRYSREHDLMHLLRCLFFFEAHFDFCVIAEHLPGVENGLADDLSHNRLDSFLLQVPGASKSSVPICPTLVELLLDSEAQWTSPTWTRRFCSTVARE